MRSTCPVEFSFCKENKKCNPTPGLEYSRNISVLPINWPLQSVCQGSLPLWAQPLLLSWKLAVNREREEPPLLAKRSRNFVSNFTGGKTSAARRQKNYQAGNRRVCVQRGEPRQPSRACFLQLKCYLPAIFGLWRTKEHATGTEGRSWKVLVAAVMRLWWR